MMFHFQRLLGVKCSVNDDLILCAVLTGQFLGWSARDLEIFHIHSAVFRVYEYSLDNNILSALAAGDEN